MMAFNEYHDKIDVKEYTPTKQGYVRVSLLLEPDRLKEMDVLTMAYSNEVKRISRHKMLKLAIDFFVESMNKKTDDDAIQTLKELHKNAMF